MLVLGRKGEFCKKAAESSLFDRLGFEISYLTTFKVSVEKIERLEPAGELPQKSGRVALPPQIKTHQRPDRKA